MSIFDSIKNALGGKAPAEDVTVAPSQLLKEAGIDPSRLDLSFGDRSITVGGEIASDEEREQVLHVLSGIKGIDTIEDNMSVAAPPAEAPAEAQPAEAEASEPAAGSDAPAEEAPAAAPAAEAAPDRSSSPGSTYTVQSGDTLWRIAENAYGNGSKYTAIFEANRDILDDPDHIRPGQELKIPELD